MAEMNIEIDKKSGDIRLSWGGDINNEFVIYEQCLDEEGQIQLIKKLAANL